MPLVTWDHIYLRSPDPEATAAWLEGVLGGVIIRGPGGIDDETRRCQRIHRTVSAGDCVHTPPI